MREFKELFEAYGGNYQVTMARFMENESFYLKILPKLFQDTSIQRLGEALDEGDLNAAFEAAHTLKGVSANLGLTPLYEAVCAIVEPLRAGEPGSYAAEYERIQAEFEKARELWERQRGEG